MTWRLGALALAASIALLSAAIDRVSVWAASDVAGGYLNGDSRLALHYKTGMHTPGLTCLEQDGHGGFVKRSPRRLEMFKRMTGYPKGRPGFHADHIVPLACGGCDVPSNLAWVRVDLKKRKDAVERFPCNGPMFPWKEAIEAAR